ncbi:hypothetical protein PHYPSEUDO_001488 [Phytophthora pseudosyringae]|uniref:Uncharacterized protein n=1 Tax=Phytophthora pseudosyringae TaxID=221518 RepID=A0A8T1VVD8_9STRA|nr:hypothetical protein PHYPSEUDO_001488 [Phytophthora pseudosyringae]
MVLAAVPLWRGLSARACERLEQRTMRGNSSSGQRGRTPAEPAAVSGSRAQIPPADSLRVLENEPPCAVHNASPPAARSMVRWKRNPSNTRCYVVARHVTRGAPLRVSTQQPGATNRGKSPRQVRSNSSIALYYTVCMQHMYS